MNSDVARCNEITQKIADALIDLGHEVKLSIDQSGFTFLEGIDGLVSRSRFSSRVYCEESFGRAGFALTVERYTSDGKLKTLKSQNGDFDFTKIARRISQVVKFDLEEKQEQQAAFREQSEKLNLVSSLFKKSGIEEGQIKGGVGLAFGHSIAFKENDGYCFELHFSRQEDMQNLFELVKYLQSRPERPPAVDGGNSSNIIQFGPRSSTTR